MGFFDKLQKPGHNALKQEKRTNHVETRKDAPIQTSYVHPIHAKRLKPPQRSSPAPRTTHSQNLRDKPFTESSSRQGTQSPSRRKRASTTPQRQRWDSESDLSDHEPRAVSKRQRIASSVEPDPSRTLRSRQAFSDEDGGHFNMVHAAIIANPENTKKYKLAFPDLEQSEQIALQYPSASQQEQYNLVVPKAEDDFKSLEDIREVIEMTIANYLPADVASTLIDDSTGLVRRLKRASSRLAGTEYQVLINEWNELLNKKRLDGTLESVISEWKYVDLKLCEFILTQTYARTVSLDVNGLKRYRNGEDNVYGELLPAFVSEILINDTGIKADQVFVDLGSGVGNVVLQAALQIGCESWGCEFMPNACKLADLQKDEFEARCRLWGLAKGDIHLEKGNFLENEAIRGALQKADVVLVNNQAFTAKLNEDLTNLFLDLKDGAKVVSLKPFAPVGSHNQSRSAGAIHNILATSEKHYSDKRVSWTDARGTYYIAKKDSRRVRAVR